MTQNLHIKKKDHSVHTDTHSQPHTCLGSPHLSAAFSHSAESGNDNEMIRFCFVFNGLVATESPTVIVFHDTQSCNTLQSVQHITLTVFAGSFGTSGTESKLLRSKWVTAITWRRGSHVEVTKVSQNVVVATFFCILKCVTERFTTI